MPPKKSAKSPPTRTGKLSATALARENHALRARLADCERERGERYGVTLASMTRDVSALIGRALIAANRGEGGAVCQEAARVFEAVRDALYVAEEGDSPSKTAVVRALGASAAKINFAVKGKGRGQIARWNEDGPVAEELRNVLAPWFARSADELKTRGATLGAALDVCAAMVTTDRILPRVGTSDERVERYDAIIEEVLATNPRSEPPMLARLAIEACAKAYGVRRPSRLFDAELKRDKREDQSGVRVNACGAPPGVVRTATNTAEVEPRSPVRLTDDTRPAPPVPARSAPSRKPLRRDDDCQVVGEPRQRSRRD